MESSETAGELPVQEAKGSFPEAVLEPEQWEQVREACVAGMSYRDAEKVFKVDYFAIKQRAWREEWPTPLKLEKMRREKTVTDVLQGGQVTDKRPETAIEALSTSFEGYRSRTLLQLAKAAENGVKRIVDADLPVESWQDAQIAATIAMKLHNVGQEGVNVNVLVGGDGGFEGPVVEIHESDTYDDEDDA